MKKIKIEKYVDNQLIDKFEVPILLVKFATKFLPAAALTELEEQGIDLQTMIKVAESDGRDTTTIEVFEHGVKTHIQISLD